MAAHLPLLLLWSDGDRGGERGVVGQQLGGGMTPAGQGVHDVEDCVLLFLTTVARPHPDEDAFKQSANIRFSAAFLGQIENKGAKRSKAGRLLLWLTMLGRSMPRMRFP